MKREPLFSCSVRWGYSSFCCRVRIMHFWFRRIMTTATIQKKKFSAVGCCLLNALSSGWSERPRIMQQEHRRAISYSCTVVDLRINGWSNKFKLHWITIMFLVTELGELSQTMLCYCVVVANDWLIGGFVIYSYFFRYTKVGMYGMVTSVHAYSIRHTAFFICTSGWV